MSKNELETPTDSIPPSNYPHSELDQALSVPLSTPHPFSHITGYNLLEHNIFTLKQDPLFASLLKLVRPIIQNSTNKNNGMNSTNGWEWLEQLIQAIFGKKSMRDLHNDFKRLDIKYNHACGKLLSHSEVYFRCLDCDQSHNTDANGYAVICAECFEKSNHKGHRVLMLKNELGSSLACSCGISSFLSQKGFCSKHGASQDKIADILAKLPQGFAEKFINTLKKAFYSVVTLFEFSGRAEGEQNQESLLALGQLAMEELLLFCTISYAEVNEAIIVLLGILFRSPLLDGHNHLWHNCGNIETNSAAPHRCTCTVLGLIFRFSSKLNEELQMKLHKILIDCAKDNDFKPFLCEEFTKYSQHIFFANNEDYHGEYARSSLVNIQRQLFTSEALREGVLKAGHFDNLIEVMRTTARDLYQNRQALYDIIESISTILSSFLNKKCVSAKKLIMETNLMKDLLEIIYHLQLKTNSRNSIGIGTHEHQVDYSSINWMLRLESIATHTLEQSFQLIMDYGEEESAPLYNEFLTSWRAYFDLISQNKAGKNNNQSISFNIALERTLVLALFNHTQELGSKEISSFMSNVASEQVLEGIVKRLGTIRYLHLSHDYNSASGLESYYGTKNLSFEKDIVGIQLLASTMDTQNTFEVLTKQFFSYEKELQTFLLEDVKAITANDYFRTKLLVLEDFLNLLVFLTNDETCTLNLTRAREESAPYSRNSSSARFENVIEKVLINALLGQYWVDITSLKNMLSTTLVETSQIEYILKRIAVFDPKTRKVRIKDEYKDELDPYLFYKMPALQKEIVHVLGSKPAEKDRKVDLVSGKFNSEKPDYLKATEKALFESTLPEFLALFVQNFNEALAPMTRPVLKLILTHLQLAKEISQENPETSPLTQKIVMNYLNKGFISNLSSMSKLKDLSDCEGCIDKIQSLLKNFANTLGQERLYATEECEQEKNKEDASASKKNQMAKRMQQLKEEFMKKQKLFMNKNTHLLGETPSEERSPLDAPEQPQQQQEDRVCQHCLEQLDDDSDIYGIPIYISFTNNLHDTQQEAKFKRDDHAYKLKSEWWPVVSSCMHYYHQKCYQTLYINSRASKDLPGNYFSNELETCCSLCKTLCNNFLPVNKTCCEETDMGSSHDEQERMKHPKLFMNFASKIDELVKDLKRRLGANPSELGLAENYTTSREIAERAYVYFLENFCHLQNSQQQKKLYDLYSKFFKVYLTANKDEASGENASFFGRLAAKNLSSLLQCQPEGLLNEVSLSNLRSYLDASNESQTGLLQSQFALLEDYIAFKTVQIASFNKDLKPHNIEQVVSLLTNSEEVQEDIAKQLTYPLQKILLAASLNQSILYGSSVGKKDFDFSDLDELLQSVFGPQITVKILIKEALKNVHYKSQESVSLLQSMLVENVVALVQNAPKIPRLAPKMIQLPKTYAEFNSMYFKKKCSRCNQFSKNLATCLCLHCGKVVCLACCHTSESDRDFGNLNKHARRYHLGSALFIEVQRLTKTVICSPVNAVYPGEDVYTDEFGQPIQHMIKNDKNSVYALDFNKFTLNPDFVEYVKNMVSTHGMAKEAFTVSKISGYYTHDNVL